MRSRPGRITAALLTAVLAVACTLDGPDAADPTATAGGDDGGGAVAAGSVDWSDCEDGDGSDDAAAELAGLRCGTVTVPLDHDDPDGPTVDIALAMRPAGDRRRRIGSLLVNPGGPGASGVELVPQLAAAMDDDVLDRFDLVGFDPRGVGRSTAVRCIDGKDELHAMDGDPDTPAEVTATLEVQRRVVDACLSRHGDLLPHLATVDAAHDLDRIRAAVGDERLTYLGFSYGTELGAAYATLYPERIRVLVLDGAVAPQVTDEDLARQQAIGFERAFAAFAEACRTDRRCAVRPDAAAVHDRVRAAAERRPIGVDRAGERRDLAIGDLQIAVVGALYDQALWAYLAEGLADADRGDGAMLLALADLYHERKADGSFPNSSDAQLAIACADSAERPTVPEAAAAAERWAQDSPRFGAQLGWSMLACDGWPVVDGAQLGVATTTDAPILVVGTRNDPATPYEWAQQLTTALAPAARLLTWEGEGHTAYLKSDCVTATVDQVLLDARLPDGDRRCAAEPDAGADTFAGVTPDLREALLGDGSLTEAEATCIAEEVAAGLEAADLLALYRGDSSDSLVRSLTAATERCTD